GALTSGGLDRLVESAIADRPAQQAGQQPQAGGHGGTRTGEPPAPGRPRPADPVDGSPTPAPRGPGRFGGGPRAGGGDGPDPLATESPAAGGPRALADEPTPRKPSAGFRTEVNELETDLPPPSGRNGPRVTRFDDLADDVARVRTFWERFKTFTREQLRERFRAIADDVRSGRRTLEEVMPECAALACEASRRTTGKAPYDEQIAGAIGLARGQIVRMLTGEGKTLAGALAAVVRALEARDAAGRPVAGRGVQWMALNPTDLLSAARTVRPIADLLGIRT